MNVEEAMKVAKALKQPEKFNWRRGCWEIADTLEREVARLTPVAYAAPVLAEEVKRLRKDEGLVTRGIELTGEAFSLVAAQRDEALEALRGYHERFSEHEDAGPRGEAWQSDEMEALAKSVAAVLAKHKERT